MTPKIRNFAVKFIGFVIAMSLIVFALIDVTSLDSVGRILRVLGGCAAVSVLLTHESIPFLVANLRYEKGLKKFTIYARESVPSPKTISNFDDLKTKVHAELAEEKALFGPNYIRSECIVLSIRILHLLCSSVPTMIFLIGSVDGVFKSIPQLNVVPRGARYALFLSARLLYGCAVFLVWKSSKQIRFNCYLAICNGIGLLFILTPLFLNEYYGYEFTFVVLATHVLMEFGFSASLYDQIEKKFTYVNRPWVFATIEVIAHILELVLIFLLSLGLNTVVYAITGVGLVVIAILLRFLIANSTV